MALKGKQLNGLPVETRSGHGLGRILNFVVDPLNQKIISYDVGRGYFMPKVLFLIRDQQVVSLSSEKMIVEDTVIKQEFEQTENLEKKATAPSAVHQSSSKSVKL